MHSIPVTRFQLRAHYLAITVIGLIILIVAKDLLHSSIRDYSFYLSESLLFGSFWIFFIPLIFLSRRSSSQSSSVMIPIIYSTIHIGLFALFVSLISTFFFSYPFGFLSTLVNTFSDSGIACILVYGFVHFYSLSNQSSDIKEDQKSTDKIAVNHKNTTMLLTCADIICIRSEKPYIALITQEKKYLHQSTLKKFFDVKCSNNFMQIHKSTIVNKDSIVSSTSRKNGDYDFKLANGEVVRASRSYSPNFKSYLEELKLG